MEEKEAKILLVDDEQPVLRSMEKTFLRQGFEVGTADNAGDALELFNAARESDEPFRVVVVDLQMPDLHGMQSPDAGFDLLRALLEAEPGLPVIVLTAFDAVLKAKAALKLGARDYLVKGREAELVQLVRKTLPEQ
jgi:DNA-binding NtrC family response regulator